VEEVIEQGKKTKCKAQLNQFFAWGSLLFPQMPG